MSGNGLLEHKNFGKKKNFAVLTKKSLFCQRKMESSSTFSSTSTEPKGKRKKSSWGTSIRQYSPLSGQTTVWFPVSTQATASKEKQSSKDKRSDFWKQVKYVEWYDNLPLPNWTLFSVVFFLNFEDNFKGQILILSFYITREEWQKILLCNIKDSTISWTLREIKNFW